MIYAILLILSVITIIALHYMIWLYRTIRIYYRAKSISLWREYNRIAYINVSVIWMSIPINIWYLIINITKIPSSIKKILAIRRDIIGLKNDYAPLRLLRVERNLKFFGWIKERGDWVPWLITLAVRDFKDDCDGIRTFGKYLYKWAGIKSYHIVLFGKDRDGEKIAHTIRVSSDFRSFLSNNKYYITPAKYWWNNVKVRYGYIGEEKRFTYEEMSPNLLPFMCDANNDQHVDCKFLKYWK